MADAHAGTVLRGRWPLACAGARARRRAADRAAARRRPCASACRARRTAASSLAAAGARVVVTWAARIARRRPTSTRRSAATAARRSERPSRVNDVAGRRARLGRAGAARRARGSASQVVWGSRAGRRVRRSRRGHAPGRATTFAPATTVHADGLTGARGWASLAVDRERRRARRLAGRTRQRRGRRCGARRASRAARDAAGPLPGRLAAGRNPRRGRASRPTCASAARRRSRRAPDGAVYVAWRHIYPAEPARHRGRALDRRRPDVRGRRCASARTAGRSTAVPTTGPRSRSTRAASCTSPGRPWCRPERAARASSTATPRDGGRTFAPRTRVDDEARRRRRIRSSRVAGDRVVVVWDESGGTRAAARVSRIATRPAGPRLQPITNLSAGASAANYPAIAATADATLVAAGRRRPRPGSDVRVRRLPRP